jgi:hypothetical protein
MKRGRLNHAGSSHSPVGDVSPYRNYRDSLCYHFANALVYNGGVAFSRRVLAV